MRSVFIERSMDGEPINMAGCTSTPCPHQRQPTHMKGRRTQRTALEELNGNGPLRARRDCLRPWM
jgi:hypothetical protein